MRVLLLVLAALLVSSCGSSGITGTPTTGVSQSAPNSTPPPSTAASQPSSKSGEGEGNFPITANDLTGMGYQLVGNNVWRARAGDIEVVQTPDGYTSEVHATDGSLTCNKMVYNNWTRVNATTAQILYHSIKMMPPTSGTHTYDLPYYGGSVICTSR